MKQQNPWVLSGDAATVRLARKMADLTFQGMSVYLHGALGAGKTSLVRAYLQALGHHGTVRSPTYTLVEPYVLPQGTAYHFDLYRLQDPEELELIGVRDYFEQGNLCLVEWAERAKDWLPVPDIELFLEIIPGGRHIRWQSGTVQGEVWLHQLEQQWLNH